MDNTVETVAQSVKPSLYWCRTNDSLYSIRWDITQKDWCGFESAEVSRQLLKSQHALKLLSDMINRLYIETTNKIFALAKTTNAKGVYHVFI